MPTCDCGSQYVMVAGVRFSPHFEPSHYSRINKGKKKAKVQVKKAAKKQEEMFSNGSSATEQAKLEQMIKEQS